MSKSLLCLEGVTAPYLELLVIPRASGIWLLDTWCGVRGCFGESRGHGSLG